MTEKRLKQLLYNALAVIENELFDELVTKEQKNEIEFLKREVSITEEELDEIEFIVKK